MSRVLLVQVCLLAAVLHVGHGNNFGFKYLTQLIALRSRLPLCTAVHVRQGGACWQPCGEALAATLLEIAADLESVFLLPSVEPGMLHLLAHLELVACR